MSYHVHRTPAIVLESIPRGDAHRTVILLTREFGCISALARGVREERSKLRFALQEYTNVEVSVVYGKGGWRITGAERPQNGYFQLTERRYQRVTLVRVLRLVRRLLQGQERNEYLFAVVERFLDTLITRSLTDDVCADAERLTVLRILHALGYVAPHDSFEAVLNTDELSHAMLVVARRERRPIVQEINRALSESHL